MLPKFDPPPRLRPIPKPVKAISLFVNEDEEGAADSPRPLRPTGAPSFTPVLYSRVRNYARKRRASCAKTFASGPSNGRSARAVRPPHWLFEKRVFDSRLGGDHEYEKSTIVAITNPKRRSVVAVFLPVGSGFFGLRALPVLHAKAAAFFLTIFASFLQEKTVARLSQAARFDLRPSFSRMSR